MSGWPAVRTDGHPLPSEHFQVTGRPTEVRGCRPFPFRFCGPGLRAGVFHQASLRFDFRTLLSDIMNPVSAFFPDDRPVLCDLLGRTNRDLPSTRRRRKQQRPLGQAPLVNPRSEGVLGFSAPTPYPQARLADGSAIPAARPRPLPGRATASLLVRPVETRARYQPRSPERPRRKPPSVTQPQAKE